MFCCVVSCNEWFGNVNKNQLEDTKLGPWIVKDGQYANLVKFMRLHDHDQFFKYTRWTVEQYEALLRLVAAHIQKAENRQAVSPGHRLTMTLQ